MFSKGIRIGRLFGIEIVLDLSWFLAFGLFVWLFAGMYMGEAGIGLDGVGATGLAIVTTLIAWASLLAHEYGHALTARQFGIGTRRIVLMLFGGVAELKAESRSPLQEFTIAVAGPAVSLLLGIVFGIGAFAAAKLGLSPALGVMLQILASLNIVWVLFNALPGFPMDGGRVLRSVVWAISKDYLFATRFAAWGGVSVGALLIAWGLTSLIPGLPFSGSLVHVLLGYFLIRLARQSIRQAEILSRFDGLTVRDLMRPVGAVLPEDTVLSEAASTYFLPMGVDQLPVVRGPRLVGRLDWRDVERTPRRQWDWVRVLEVVRPYGPDDTLDVREAALSALQRLATNNRQSMAVFDGRRLMGHVFRGDLVELLNRTPRG